MGTWTDPVILAGPNGTHIRKVHIDEIRTAIDNHVGAGGTVHALSLPTSDQSGGRAGFMSAQQAEELKNLVAIEGGWITSVGVTAPLTKTGTATQPNIVLSAAASGQNGYMLGTDKVKLDTVAASATKNQTDTYLLDRANHTGTMSADKLTDGTNNKLLSTTNKDKLDNMDANMPGEVKMFWPLTGSIVDYFFIGGSNDGLGKTVAQGAPQDMSKWVLCNGTTKAPGVTVPDFRDRFALCAGSFPEKIKSETLEENPNTQYLGEAKHKLTGDETGEHAHYFSGDDEIAYGIRGSNPYITDDEVAQAKILYPNSHVTKTIDYDAKSNGGGGRGYKTQEFQKRGVAHNNMPPYITVWYIMRYKI